MAKSNLPLGITVEYERSKTAATIVATDYLNLLAHPSPNAIDEKCRDRFPKAVAALQFRGPRGDGRSQEHRYRGRQHALRRIGIGKRSVGSALRTANERLGRRWRAAVATVDFIHELDGLGITVDPSLDPAKLRALIRGVDRPWKRIARAAEGPVGRDINGQCPSYSIRKVWSESRPVLHLALGFFCTTSELMLRPGNTAMCEWGCWEWICNADLWLDRALEIGDDALARIYPILDLDPKIAHAIHLTE